MRYVSGKSLEALLWKTYREAEISRPLPEEDLGMFGSLSSLSMRKGVSFIGEAEK